VGFLTHTNFAVSTVAVAPSPASSGTSLTVATGNGSLFPTNSNVVVSPAGVTPTSANSEICLVTNQSGDVLTLTRQQESTSARSIVVGDSIIGGPTALWFTAIESLMPQTGDYKWNASNAALTGWLLCDGSAVSRSTYAALFASIGTAFGTGDGSTTFNLPNPAGKTPVGVGTGTTSDVITQQVVPSNSPWVVPSNTDRWITGQAVTFNVSAGGTAPGGFTNGTTYYVNRVTSTVITLCASLANAITGLPVSYTTTGSGTFTIKATLTARVLGASGGEETHTQHLNELNSHHHTIADSINVDTQSTSPVLGTFDGRSALGGSDGGDQAPLSTLASQTGDVGGGLPTNNMPPYLAIGYLFIKT
jgi:microcystin-dependent protein